MLWPNAIGASCLSVLPPAKFAEILEKLDRMPMDDSENSQLKRALGTHSDMVSLDKAGRLPLPKHLAVGAGIEQEVVLVGCLDHFEIWNPEACQEVLVAAKKSQVVVD